MDATMYQILRERALHDHLEHHGWARLPSLDAAVLDRLRRLAGEMEAELTRHRLSSDVGFDELWGHPDLARRRDFSARIAAELRPFLDRCCQGFRPVLYNMLVKRARSQQSGVRFHQDFALLDERGGDTALQLWIPLVDVTVENGALVVIDGTHLEATWLRPHDFRHALFEHSLFDLPAAAVRLPLRAGDGIAFTNRTVHGSPPNLSPASRAAVGVILVPRDAGIVHWVRRDSGEAELWALSDEDLHVLQPGRLPPGARLVETVSA